MLVVYLKVWFQNYKFFFLQSHIIWAWYLTKVCTLLQHGTAPTFWIALTFSLWPPEMGDPNLNNLTASLEELSLKKQLPLRQTTQKPVLKYNQSMTRGSSQFYNQQKVIAIGKYNIQRAESHSYRLIQHMTQHTTIRKS